VETCAGEGWSPALEVGLEIAPREFRFEITANEGPLGRSAIRRRAAVGEVTAPLHIRAAQPPAARDFFKQYRPQEKLPQPRNPFTVMPD
jgi:hypothetical protein